MTNIDIQIVKGGFILELNHYDLDDKPRVQSTEVFPTKAKLIKALREFIDEYSLVGGKSEDVTEV